MYDAIFKRNICLRIRILFVKQSTDDCEKRQREFRMYAAGDTHGEKNELGM